MFSSRYRAVDPRYSCLLIPSQDNAEGSGSGRGVRCTFERGRGSSRSESVIGPPNTSCRLLAFSNSTYAAEHADLYPALTHCSAPALVSMGYPRYSLVAARCSSSCAGVSSGCVLLFGGSSEASFGTSGSTLLFASLIETPRS